MPNKYKYNHTFEELREEEDREVLNDYYREKTYYYQTLSEINEIFLDALSDMSKIEIKDIIKSNLTVPVRRL